MWCRLTGAPDTEAGRLRATLRSIRADETRWARQVAAGHRAVQEDMASLEQCCACRKCRLCRSSGPVVFVEDVAQTWASADVEVGDLVLAGDQLWQWL